jgi:hypothetical protein
VKFRKEKKFSCPFLTVWIFLSPSRVSGYGIRNWNKDGDLKLVIFLLGHEITAGSEPL